jgi:hypothetical protein
MKFGFDAIRDRFNGNNIAPPVYGEYDFSGIYTGSGYADFLLGIPQTTELSLPNPNRNLRGTTIGIYAQDQFKVSSRLTLNYGLRWELPEPYSDKHGAIYTFDPATGGLVVQDNGASLINPFYPTNIPVTTASKAGYPSNLINMDKRNIEPRVGFAYKLFGSDKTVLRGGYGIYTNLIYAAMARTQMSGGPFSGNVTYRNSITGGVPLFSFPEPFLQSGTTATQNVLGVNPNLKTPYTQQWNLTLERQVGSYGFRASYTGSRSVDLLYLRNLNEPAPSATPFSTALYPYQTYSQISYADSGGNDFYNDLELEVQKKYGKNLTITSGYTWAKDMTDTQDNGGGGTTYAGQLIQNQFCRACEKSNDELIPPHRLFAYGLYTLPVGTGQHFLSTSHGVVQQVLGGWVTTWTVVVQSGQFFTPSFSGFDPSNTGVLGGVPDRIGNGNLPAGQRTVADFFNTTAFMIPGCTPTTPVCSTPANVGRFGTSGWNYLAGPPLRGFDFGLGKDFKIYERVQLRFTMTMANALNHPVFTSPSSNISSPGTDGLLSTETRVLEGEVAPREIDFALRLTF